MRNASSSNALGLIGRTSPSRSSRCPPRSAWTRAQVDDGRRPIDGHALLGPPEERPDPGRQLAQAERLGDVVVGAELQPDDLVELGVLGRQHDDRHARLGADDAADLDARQLREHQVQEDEVRSLGPEHGQGLAAVGRGDDPESVGLERVDERLAEGGLVVDDEDRSCHAPSMIRTRVNEPLSSPLAIACRRPGGVRSRSDIVHEQEDEVPERAERERRDHRDVAPEAVRPRPADEERDRSAERR